MPKKHTYHVTGELSIDGELPVAHHSRGRPLRSWSVVHGGKKYDVTDFHNCGMKIVLDGEVVWSGERLHGGHYHTHATTLSTGKLEAILDLVKDGDERHPSAPPVPPVPGMRRIEHEEAEATPRAARKPARKKPGPKPKAKPAKAKPAKARKKPGPKPKKKPAKKKLTKAELRKVRLANLAKGRKTRAKRAKANPPKKPAKAKAKRAKASSVDRFDVWSRQGTFLGTITAREGVDALAHAKKKHAAAFSVSSPPIPGARKGQTMAEASTGTKKAKPGPKPKVKRGKPGPKPKAKPAEKRKHGPKSKRKGPKTRTPAQLVGLAKGRLWRAAKRHGISEAAFNKMWSEAGQNEQAMKKLLTAAGAGPKSKPGKGRKRPGPKPKPSAKKAKKPAKKKLTKAALKKVRLANLAKGRAAKAAKAGKKPVKAKPARKPKASKAKKKAKKPAKKKLTKAALKKLRLANLAKGRAAKAAKAGKKGAKEPKANKSKGARKPKTRTPAQLEALAAGRKKRHGGKAKAKKPGPKSKKGKPGPKKARASKAPPSSKPMKPMVDRDVLAKIKADLKKEGQEHAFPSYKKIWENGGKQAALAWMQSHKSANVVEAFGDWLSKHTAEAQAMMAA